MTRFECPRCQTVFTRDEGGDDAFVECPSCGAMAMAAGEATGVDSDALARTLSSTHDVPAIQRNLEATADGDAEGARDDRTAAAPDGASDDNSDDDQRAPEDSSRAPRPSMSDEGEAPAGGGIFNNLLGGFDDGAPPPPPAPSTKAPVTSPGTDRAGLDLGLDDELGDFDLPVAAAPKPAPKAKTASRPAPARRVAEGEAPVSTPDFVAPPPASENVDVNLGEDAMGALEAAFDSLAAAPPVARRGGGLSDDERRFLENVMGSAPPPPPPRASKPPPRPPEKPGVPRAAPPPLKKRPPSSGFALTPEAREAAFIPLKTKRAQPKPPPPPPPRADDPEITSPNDLAPRRPGRPARSPEDLPELPPPASAGGAIDDAISKVPTATKATRVARPKPSVWGGLHKGAFAAAILVGLLGGAGAGAALAPAQQKRTDGRARAELALADGNRYYEAARYDDALGKYKNAINNDRTYAPAHRAKGAALAKQGMMAAQAQQGEQAQRLWDEAAAAYREYLALEPSAIDGADIKDALARRGVAPVATGTPPPPPAPAPAPPEGGAVPPADGAGAPAPADGASPGGAPPAPGGSNG